VHAADISESDGAKDLLSDIAGKHPRVEKLLLNGGYNIRNFADWVKATPG
jgi:hypothetical protein